MILVVLAPLWIGCVGPGCWCCCSRSWLCSALLMTNVSSTNLSQRVGGWERTGGFDFKLFHEDVGYEGADGGSHSCTLYLFIILTLEEEVGVGKEELQQEWFGIWTWRSFVVEWCPVVAFVWQFDGWLYWNWMWRGLWHHMKWWFPLLPTFLPWSCCMKCWVFLRWCGHWPTRGLMSVKVPWLPHMWWTPYWRLWVWGGYLFCEFWVGHKTRWDCTCAV